MIKLLAISKNTVRRLYDIETLKIVFSVADEIASVALSHAIGSKPAACQVSAYLDAGRQRAVLGRMPLRASRGTECIIGKSICIYFRYLTLLLWVAT